MKTHSIYKLFHALAIFFLLIIFNVAHMADAAAPAAYFVFGDSLVDHGNNNYLLSLARADSPPYGLDFPAHKATGRFSNGLTMADIIGEYFGLQPLEPYLSPNMTGENLLNGANFASAGVGILDDTGIQFLDMIRIKEQLNLFKQYQNKVKRLVGLANTRKLIRESISLISLGGNDFINNYFLPHSLRSETFTIHDYCELLIVQYEKILKRLHKSGARKIIVTGTGPIGCAPGVLAMRSRHGECAEDVQNAGLIYNRKLTRMIIRLNKKMGGDIFIFSHMTRFHSDIISNPKAYGFDTSKIACCGQGPYNGLGVCTFFSLVCDYRDKYVFWDAFHPTEKANRLIVQKMIFGSSDHIRPMNLSTIKAKFFMD